MSNYRESRQNLLCRLKRLARRTMAVALAAGMVMGGAAVVKAATLEDVFDAKAYADKYADLKDAFGYDEAALLQHYLTYGIAEGREGFGLLDVVKYREAYPDLDAAFGDNWNAYVEHYLTHGAAEHRENFTDFDVNVYLENNADLKEAFGEDVLALYEHYQTLGKDESRIATEEEYEAYLAEQEEEEEPEESQKPEDSGSQNKKPQDGIVDSYDANGRKITTQEYKNGVMIKRILYGYDKDGSIDHWVEFEYDESGKHVKDTYHLADDSIYSIMEYDESGKLVKGTDYEPDGEGGVGVRVTEYDGAPYLPKSSILYYAGGSVRRVDKYEYNESGKLVKDTGTLYNKDGSVYLQTVEESEYNESGKRVKNKNTVYNANGDVEYWTESEYDESGKLVKLTYYNADGSVKNVSEY